MGVLRFSQHALKLLEKCISIVVLSAGQLEAILFGNGCGALPTAFPGLLFYSVLRDLHGQAEATVLLVIFLLLCMDARHVVEADTHVCIHQRPVTHKCLLNALIKRLLWTRLPL